MEDIDPLKLSHEDLASLMCEIKGNSTSGSNANGILKQEHKKKGADLNDEVDIYIANALNQLSMEERDKVYRQVHGVDEVIEETHTFCSQKIHALRSRLQERKQTHAKRKAFLMAIAQESTVVFSEKNCLRFLRAEEFDVTKAADRMISFYDLKLYLFGAEKLLPEITLNDLSVDDMNSFRAGFMQMLPHRDRAGRGMLILIPTFQTYAEPENMSRVLFYMFMTSLEDIETQKRGLALIIYDVGKFDPTRTDLKTVVQGCWVLSCVPAKACSLHHCFNDPVFRTIVNLSMKFFGETTRARAKMHHGSHLECAYELMTYGIPIDLIPLTSKGGLKRKNHLEFLKMRLSQETNMKGLTLDERAPCIVVPSVEDVLYGRGKPFQHFVGNMRLSFMLDKHLESYEAMRNAQKSDLINTIVDAIRQSGGRFLMKQDGVSWSEVDSKMAHQKVSSAFRTRRKLRTDSVRNSSLKGTIISQPVTSSLEDAMSLDKSKEARTL